MRYVLLSALALSAVSLSPVDAAVISIRNAYTLSNARIVPGGDPDGVQDANQVFASSDTFADGLAEVELLTEDRATTDGDARVISSADPVTGALRVFAEGTPAGFSELAVISVGGRVELAETYVATAAGSVTATLDVGGAWEVPTGVGFTASVTAFVGPGEPLTVPVDAVTATDPGIDRASGSVDRALSVTLPVEVGDLVSISWLLDAGFFAQQSQTTLRPGVVDFSNTAIAGLRLEDGAELSGGDDRLFSAQLSTVPLPGTLTSLLLGMGVLGALRRRG